MLGESHPACHRCSLMSDTCPQPETELLLTCLRPGCEPGAAVTDAALRDVDWQRFVTLATNHHVIPLVYQALRRTPHLPPSILARLRNDRMSIAAHSLRATMVLHRIQQRAAAQGIDLIPIKGPALAILAYGREHESMRQFEDLDLVVHQRDLPRAIEWLEGEGYVPHSLLQAPRVHNRYLATRQAWGLHKAGDPLYLEVKPTLIWHALSHPDSADYLARESREMPLDHQRSLRAPGPEAMLLTVCIDGVQDMWTKLAAVADVAHLLTAFPLADWDRLMEDAAAMGQKRTLLVGVSVANRLLDCPLPKAFRDAVHADAEAVRLSELAANQMRAGAAGTLRLDRTFLFVFRTRERVRDQWRFVWRSLFVPGLAELDQIPLPPALYALYALTRPFRLAWDMLFSRGRPRQLHNARVKNERTSE